MLPIVIIRDKTQFTKYKFRQLDIKTNARKMIFTNQTWMYHAIKFLSSSLRDGSDFTLFFTNGAKNITAAIAESLASDEIMFFSVSIIGI